MLTGFLKSIDRSIELGHREGSRSSNFFKSGRIKSLGRSLQDGRACSDSELFFVIKHHLKEKIACDIGMFKLIKVELS
jgi:hypothetical protein